MGWEESHSNGLNHISLIENSMYQYSPPQRLVLWIQIIVILRYKPLPDATPNMAAIRGYVDWIWPLPC